VIYQRAKGQMQTVPFGTQRDVYALNYEWVEHSMAAKHVEKTDLRVDVGGKDCTKPYSASLLNISAMSYGALSTSAVKALNWGAKKGNFAHNTGEGSISPYHMENGGDLIWQIGTGYFGCRTLDGKFNPEMFKEKASMDQVKMIEIKLSQGAKPGHGGILPAAKVNAEVAEIRGVEIGKDVNSPPSHNEFSNPIEMMMFIQKLRELSGGKPVGFKLCVGQKHEFIALCKAMIKTGITPDFITVDGGEGGTGAAPIEFTNSIGTPLEDGLTFVHDMLVGFGLKDQIKIIASGKVLSAFHILCRMALGADMVYSARGFMLSLGCIQALRCNSNDCPTGIATNEPGLVRGLVVPLKADRVFHFHDDTMKALAEMLGAMGLEGHDDLIRSHINRRVSRLQVMNYEEMYPLVKSGTFLNGEYPQKYSKYFPLAQAESFAEVRA
jgi:glutamate synthase domain-containing protein 2